MKCKCRHCRESIEKENAYKVLVNKNYAYYCNESEYIEFVQKKMREEQEKEARKKVSKQSKGKGCKCLICGKPLLVEHAYRIDSETNKKNPVQYYCSQEEYEENEKRKKKKAEDYYAVENAITEIFGYKVENTILHKEWKRWNNLADNEQIAQYLQKNKNYICNVMSNKTFKYEGAKIKYLSAILCNNLIDFTSRIKEEQQPKIQVEETFYEPQPMEIVTPVKPIKQRRSLADLEDMF